MSEYQYYEFQAVDRPLTKKQVTELRCYSSRAQITPSSFVNVYNWGNFKGDPDEWMEKFFDAFLYLANWGSRWFMLRIPKRLLEPDIALIYCTEENLSCSTKGDHLILSFHSEEEDYEWTEGEGWLTSLVPLRADLMHGDHRCLYLGWLLGVQGGELDDETLEALVPPGLGDLSAPLQSFADFLQIAPDLIAAAAEKSAKGPTSDLSKENIARWVADLPVKDKDAIIMSIVEGEDPLIAAELRQRALREIHDASKSGGQTQSNNRRSVSQLIARAEEITEERQKNEAEQREREKARREREQAVNRKKHLESLVGKEGDLWGEVDQFIATRQPKRYNEAVSLLQDLHDLADMQGKSSEFSLRMNALYSHHMKKTALLDRFRKAKLLG